MAPAASLSALRMVPSAHDHEGGGTAGEATQREAAMGRLGIAAPRRSVGETTTPALPAMRKPLSVAHRTALGTLGLYRPVVVKWSRRR